MSTPEHEDEAAEAGERGRGADPGERRDRRQSDVDAVWADIVSRWEGDVPSGTGPDAEPEPLGPPEPATPAVAMPAVPVPLPAGPRDHALAEEEDRYVPPAPPPLSTGGWGSFLPWAGVLGGPLLLVLAAVFYRSVPGVVLAVAVAAFVAGAALLVLRLPTRRGDDGDDGAVV